MPYLKDRCLRTVEQTMQRLAPLIYTSVSPLKITCYATQEPVDYAHRAEGEELRLEEGGKWGEKVFDCAWFHFEGVIPAACQGKPTVMLLDIGGEGLIVDENGEPVQGVTCVDSGFDFSLGKPGKWVYPWAESGEAGQKVDFWMDGANNDLFGVMRNDGRVRLAQIGIWDKRLFNLFYDLAVLVDYLRCADQTSARYNQVLFKLYDACVKTDAAFSPESSGELEEAARFLCAQKGGDAPLRFTAIGHAHMDLAWLWPIRETKRKGARTFATALSLMDRYPEYRFGASQPQLFQWMKESYPGLYERIKEKVKEGRLEVQGCMWVEADTNLSGGEALVRQILYGKRFFKEEFGKDIRVLWLPDVFGYNAALPQILKKSGNDVFMTQKLSWSQHNKFPHQTFRWRGIDGTEIFTHMLPEETYNSPILPRSLRFAEKNYADAGVCDEALILFGIGDGGGGPGMEHLEAARRVRDFYGLCPVEQAEAQPMLLRLKEKCFDRAPVWQGELYLERHQGTYTTSARNKKYNRKMEIALRELEFFCVLSEKPCKEQLDEIWKEVLLYQFHDILPGSSIQRVYTESQARYKMLAEQTEALIRERASALAGGKQAFFNSLSWPRETVYQGADGVYKVTVPAMGCTFDQGEKITPFLRAEGRTLENERLIAAFDESGALVSCVDKLTGRETLSAPSNRYAVYREYNADCWDIAIEYTDKAPEYFTLAEQSFRVEGVKAVCSQRYTYGNSVIEVEAHLDAGSEYVAFDMRVDWQEQDKMLRTSFDTAVTTDKAGFDIQYGLLHRSNHENTLWDKAQFEVCGHKFVDLSEADWGVSLLNDCKYGFRAKGGVIDMNILRAQHYPSDLTDRGVHTLSYALYPHAGNEKGGRVKEKAYEFNIPLRFVPGNAAKAEERCAVKAQNAIVEALKFAEDGNGLILRAYEPYGTHAPMKITLDGTYRITPCDLLENPAGPAETASAIEGEIKPFEILTYRLTR